MNGFVSRCSTGTFPIPERVTKGLSPQFIGFMPRHFGALILLTSAATIGWVLGHVSRAEGRREFRSFVFGGGEIGFG